MLQVRAVIEAFGRRPHASRPRGGVLAGILVEGLAWHGIGACFLAAYLALHSVGGNAVAAHLPLLTVFWIAIASLRVAVWRWFPGDRLPRLSNALLVTTALVLLVSYYAAVLIGLQSWGRVISWTLIETYAFHASDLLGVLEISPLVAGSTVALIVLGTFSLLAWEPSRRDWARPVGRSMSPLAVLVCVLAGLSIVSARIYAFAAHPPASEGEPVSLTFFPDQASRAKQSHTWGSMPAREAAEDAARLAYVPAANASRKNVVLIVGDALRPDHMSIHGYSRDTTPHLAEWMRKVPVSKAERMIAVCAESTCGLLGISRSKYVDEISERDFSLSDVLRRHGYRIHLILSGDHTNFYGLRDAYGQVDSYFDGASSGGHYMNDDRIVLDRVASLPVSDGQPVMFQFHLMSTHALGTRHPSARHYQPITNYYGVKSVRAAGTAATAGEVNFYDNGVVQFDEMVSQILGDLESKGYLNDALVVITADHGELLGEYGEIGHAKSVREEVLRVPFVMLHFGHQPERQVPQQKVASQVDIAPTLLDAMRMPIPTTWSGRSLYAVPSRAIIKFQQNAEVGLLDMRHPGRLWKYWLDFRTGEEFASDVTERADESHNRIGEVPAQLRQDWKRRTMEGGATVVLRD